MRVSRSYAALYSRSVDVSDERQWVFSYEEDVRKTEVVGPLGASRVFHFDGSGRCERIESDSEDSLSRTFDRAGRLLRETQGCSTSRYSYATDGSVTVSLVRASDCPACKAGTTHAGGL